VLFFFFFFFFGLVLKKRGMELGRHFSGSHCCGIGPDYAVDWRFARNCSTADFSMCSCGWGSASLYFAEKYPNSQITAFSNSRTQKEFIDSVAASKGFQNLTVITGDVVDYTFEASVYDRVVSIELFEHMKNYELLMEKVAHALKPGGLLFVHIFCHKETPYDFDGGWMSEHFFTGGMYSHSQRSVFILYFLTYFKGTMPSADLLLFFQRDLRVKKQWWVNGQHYAQTCEDWLTLMLKNKDQIWPHLVETYGEQDVVTWWNRWQIFYMACAELFRWEGGDTWGVTHLLFEKPA
jgi:cyclopropane fatty-acyl-phospholipid synthase-like methyltransferase